MKRSICFLHEAGFEAKAGAKAEKIKEQAKKIKE